MALRKRLMTLTCLLTLGMGCAAAVDIEDPEDEMGLVGKADGSSYTECEKQAIVDALNAIQLDDVDDLAAARDEFRALGRYSTAARCMAFYRLGYDARSRSAGGDGCPRSLPAGFVPEPRQFESAREVDSVSYVGVRTLGNLVEATRAVCDAAPGETQLAAVFSPAPSFEESHAGRIKQLIDNAERSIDINMYSFSQADLIEALVDRAGEVDIRVLYDKGHHGRGLETTLEDAGIEVRYVGQTNHHKYAIFDGAHAAGDDPAAATISTGSANWSDGAVGTYDESTVFISGNAELTLRYQQEFNLMWNHSMPIEGHEEIEYFETMEITDAMIDAVDDPTVDAVFTSSNFFVNSRGFLQGRKDGYDVADRWVEAIMNAEDSIWVFQERARSVPIANALLAKAAADPGIEIRIFMDNQDYEDAEDSAEMMRDLQSCYDGARTETQTFNCEQGLKYSYALANMMDGDGTDADPNPNHEVRLSYYAVNWNYTFHQMHQKSMVVDGRWIYTGSYNASFNSEFNSFENVLILDGAAHPEFLRTFSGELENLWDRGVSDGSYDELMSRVDGTASSVPIRLDPPISMNLHQVADYRGAVGRACGWTQLGQLRNNEERAWSCTRR